MAEDDFPPPGKDRAITPEIVPANHEKLQIGSWIVSLTPARIRGIIDPALKECYAAA